LQLLQLQVAAGRRVLIVAHGNALRALIQVLALPTESACCVCQRANTPCS